MTGTSLNHQTWWRHATETPWGQRLIALSRIVSPSKLLATPTTPQPHSPPQRQLPAIFTYTHSPSHTTPFATQHTHTQNTHTHKRSHTLTHTPTHAHTEPLAHPAQHTLLLLLQPALRHTESGCAPDRGLLGYAGLFYQLGEPNFKKVPGMYWVLAKRVNGSLFLKKTGVSLMKVLAALDTTMLSRH